VDWLALLDHYRSHHTTRWHIDDNVDRSVFLRSFDQPVGDCPVPQRHGPVAARGREAFSMPEQDAEMSTGVVRGRDEAAVHVGVASGLVA
jgi:hypothetical protein